MSAPNADRVGYKETKVGWIPEEWQAMQLLDTTLSTQLGGNYTGSLIGTGTPLIKMGNMGRGSIVLSKLERLDPTCEPAGRDFLKQGDFLFNTRNTLSLVGKTCLWRGELGAAVFNSNILRVTFDETFLGSTEFACRAFNTEYALRQLRAFAIGTTSVAAIYWRDLRRFWIILPSCLEQKKIAEILSTCDEAIEKTGALIEAKKQQKKALMQQLLSGEKRLPGFKGEWMEVEIGDLFKEVSRPVVWDDEELYNLISVRRRSGGLFFRAALHGKDILTKVMNTTHTRDFLISKMQVVHGAMAMTPPEFDGGHVSGSYITLVSKDDAPIHMPFFDYLSRTKWLYHLTFISSYGVVIEKMTFNLKDFLKKTIEIPPTIEEQERISEILKTCEDEGSALDLKLAALKQQKKALMQKLLTGQIRVKV